MALVYPKTSGSEMHVEIAKRQIAALNDRTLELKILEREPADLDAAYTISDRLESYAGANTDEYKRNCVHSDNDAVMTDWPNEWLLVRSRSRPRRRKRTPLRSGGR